MNTKGFDSTHPIPKAHVESEVAMEELMVLVVELGVRLPRLPPLRLERDARVVQNAVVVVVYCYCVEWH